MCILSLYFCMLRRVCTPTSDGSPGCRRSGERLPTKESGNSSSKSARVVRVWIFPIAAANQSFFKLAAIFCPCHQCAHIQLDKAFVFESFGHIPINNPLRQPFDDGSLADARFTDQRGIVLRAAGQNLNRAANLFVTPDDWVEFSLPRHCGQVSSVFFQRLESSFGILRSGTLSTAHLCQSACALFPNWGRALRRWRLGVADVPHQPDDAECCQNNQANWNQPHEDHSDPPERRGR